MSPEVKIGPGWAEFLASMAGKEVPLNASRKRRPESDILLAIKIARPGKGPTVKVSLDLSSPEGEKETVPLIQI